MTEYDVLLSAPIVDKPNLVRILATDGTPIFASSGSEPRLVRDTEHDQSAPTWLAYARDGTAQGEPVYAHYGRSEDFERLEDDHDIDVTDKIVIVRYGGWG